MKKLFSMILMSVVLFAACTDENGPVVEQLVTIQASIADGSRVALDDIDETIVNWSTGDVINLTINELQYPFIWQEGTTFAYTGNETLPALELGTVITAIYAPAYDSQTGLKADIGNYMVLSATETVGAGEGYKDLDFTFSHETSVLKLTISNDDFKGADVTGITLKAGGTVVATATETFKGAKDGHIVVYFAIPSSAFNMQNVTLHATCGANTYFATMTDKVLTSGKLYKATATLAKACFLPNGVTFKMAILNELDINADVKAIKFVAGISADKMNAAQPFTHNYYKMPPSAKYEIIDADGINPKTLIICTDAVVFMFNSSCYMMFEGGASVSNKLSEITTIDFGKCINTSNVTSMTDMFTACSSLTSLDLSSFDTSNVTSMKSMFYRCKSLSSLNLTGFQFKDDANVGYMFQSAGASSGFTIKVDQAGYNFLKDKNTSINSSYAKFVKSDGTSWE